MTDNKNLVPKDDEIKSTHIQHQENHNCQQFFGPISGCVFAMPGANVTMSNGELSNTNKEKAHCKDSSFKFEVEDKQEFNIAIQQFTNILKEAKLVPDDMDYLKMTRLFSGESCKTRYIWKGTKTFLHHLINKLCDGDNPIITTYPDGVSRWDVVSCRFYDEKGNSLGDISHCNSEQNNDKEMLIDKLYKAFADSL